MCKHRLGNSPGDDVDDHHDIDVGDDEYDDESSLVIFIQRLCKRRFENSPARGH